MGRVFTAHDDQVPEAHPVAVASYGYWRRRFGGDAAVLGRVLRISGTPITIVGVAPAGFFGEQVGEAPDLWLPLTMWGDVVPGANFLENPRAGWLRMIGRARPGVAISGAQSRANRDVPSSRDRNVRAEHGGRRATRHRESGAGRLPALAFSCGQSETRRVSHPSCAT
jgi:hypothetical protein